MGVRKEHRYILKSNRDADRYMDELITVSRKHYLGLNTEIENLRHLLLANIKLKRDLKRARRLINLLQFKLNIKDEDKKASNKALNLTKTQGHFL